MCDLGHRSHSFSLVRIQKGLPDSRLSSVHRPSAWLPLCTSLCVIVLVQDFFFPNDSYDHPPSLSAPRSSLGLQSGSSGFSQSKDSRACVKTKGVKVALPYACLHIPFPPIETLEIVRDKKSHSRVGDSYYCEPHGSLHDFNKIDHETCEGVGA